MDDEQLLKGQTFFAGIFVLLCVQFGYIAFSIIISGTKISDIGDLFVVYAICNFLEIYAIMVTILKTGAKINDLDQNLKQILF